MKLLEKYPFGTASRETLFKLFKKLCQKGSMIAGLVCGAILLHINHDTSFGA
jgi:hypothetical protein